MALDDEAQTVRDEARWTVFTSCDSLHTIHEQDTERIPQCRVVHPLVLANSVVLAEVMTMIYGAFGVKPYAPFTPLIAELIEKHAD